MKKRTKVVGITGGIGAGKSLVGKIFQTLGVPLYSADTAAKQVMRNNTDLKEAIKKQFGKDAYHNSGEVNAKYIAEIVFQDKTKLDLINALVHPVVAKDFSQWTQKNMHHKYIIKESALLLQTEEYKFLDCILYISAPKQVRIERIQKRDPQRTMEEITSIINSQITEQKAITKATHLILNDDKTMLLPQIIAIHNQFTASICSI
ncbi:MAG: dephospho-CoA kinase [Chitinophagaceae bacterium]|nr:dephospho-CoA kinase [Chitinophagaceae bacterium]